MTLKRDKKEHFSQGHSVHSLTVHVLYNKYYLVFGFRQTLMFDQALEFSGKVIAALCALFGIALYRKKYHALINNESGKMFN